MSRLHPWQPLCNFTKTQSTLKAWKHALHSQTNRASISSRFWNGKRWISTSSHCMRYNSPPTNSQMMRAGGISSMCRLPVHQNTDGLDACFVGVPLDAGCSGRPGARFGPRYIRMESVMCRIMSNDTGAIPFQSIMVGDVGDVNFCQYDIVRACSEIREHFSKLIQNGCRTLALGGDHTMTFPILQAMKDKYGPVGLIHVDAHTDIYGDYMNHRHHHGNCLQMAYDDGCLDTHRVMQIGQRGTGNGSVYGTDHDKSRHMGFRLVPVRECWWRSLTPLMEEVREMMGDHPVYLSFCIDALDPAFAPATSSPEPGGLTSIQALEIIRGCRGMNIVGCELTEVCPVLDVAGMTSMMAANLLMEMLFVLPGVKYLEVK